jgi:hypothetical protein
MTAMTRQSLMAAAAVLLGVAGCGGGSARTDPGSSGSNTGGETSTGAASCGAGHTDHDAHGRGDAEDENQATATP